MSRDRLLFLLKLFVSVGLIVVLVQRVDVDEVWGLLRGARLPLLLAVELLPDIFRTLGNVTADLAVTAILSRRLKLESGVAPG